MSSGDSSAGSREPGADEAQSGEAQPAEAQSAAEGPYPARTSDPKAARALAEKVGVSPTTGQVLLHRDLSDPEAAKVFLDPRLSQLTSPVNMVDRDAATERIVRAIQKREKIAVFGDYDVDGTTSSAILSDIVEALGGDVTSLVANRFQGGYGFSEAALDRCLETGASLIVTCDCGSSDHPRIERANQSGCDVIVVDHHLVPKEPLPALAFLNPHRPDCGFPEKGLASAGLVFSLGAALRRGMDSKLDLRPWLDLVALGTVADVAPLSGDNRPLVRAGLRVLSSGNNRPGIRALMEAAKVEGHVGAVDIAFRLAPRLNAAGRLGDPQVTLDLLRSRNMDNARALAQQIEAINEERKAVERQVTEEAIAQVIDIYGDAPKSGIVVAQEGWHRGVVGITAARLVDRFQRPAIVIGIDDGKGHGSCRTPDGFPLYDAVKACSEHLVTFGGHQAAAGLTIEAQKLDAFRAAFSDSSARVLPEKAPSPLPMADVCISDDGFGLPAGQDLLRLEPMGEMNPIPVVSIVGATVASLSGVGVDSAHLKLSVRSNGTWIKGFGFNLGHLAQHGWEKVHVLGTPQLDTWRGGGAVELRVIDVRGA